MSIGNFLFERKFVQSAFQLFGLREADAEAYFAGVIVSLTDDARIHLLDNAHDVVHHGVGESVGHYLFYLTRLYLTVGEGVGRCFSIGDDESAGAKVHASVVAHDDDETIRQFCGVDLAENRLAGCG